MTAIRAQFDVDVFKVAVGEYKCPCGSHFEFGTFDSLADYAALNRWLGRHYDDCPDIAGSAPALRARVDELTALAKAQSDEIRSLNLQLDQARRKKGWLVSQYLRDAAVLAAADALADDEAEYETGLLIPGAAHSGNNE